QADFAEFADVAGLPGGGYLAAWNDGAFSIQVYTASYGNQGQPVAPAGNVTNTSNLDVSPIITPLAGGGYVLTWQEQASGVDIFTSAFDAQGQQLSAPSNVLGVAGSQSTAESVTALTTGGYAVSFFHAGDIFTVVYDAQGQQVA